MISSDQIIQLILLGSCTFIIAGSIAYVELNNKGLRNKLPLIITGTLLFHLVACLILFPNNNPLVVLGVIVCGVCLALSFLPFFDDDF